MVKTVQTPIVSGRAFTPKCNERHFNPREWKKLLQFGKTLQDLADGRTRPTHTRAQRFVMVCRGKEEPKYWYEFLWLKYRKECRRIKEGDSDEDRVQAKSLEHKRWETETQAATTEERVYEAEPWGSRDDWKKMRRGQFRDMKQRQRE